MVEMTLSTAIQRFEAQLRANGKSPRTLDCYMWDLGRLAAALGPRTPIRSITPHRLAVLVNSTAFACTPNGAPKKPASVNRSKTAIRMFFRFLVDSDYIPRDPARLVRYARVPRPPARAMSAHDVEQLFATVRKHRNPRARRDELMFRMMLGTGIRLGSLAALNADDVDVKTATVRIRAKGGIEQTVYLNPQLRRALAHHIRIMRTAGALFRSGPDRRIGTRQVQIRFAYWRDQAELDRRYSVHSMRHTFATRLYQQTRDLHLVREALGHASVGTTQRYAAVATQRLRAAVSRLR